jgi:hypothetical protein
MTPGNEGALPVANASPALLFFTRPRVELCNGDAKVI